MRFTVYLQRFPVIKFVKSPAMKPMPLPAHESADWDNVLQCSDIRQDMVKSLLGQTNSKDVTHLAEFLDCLFQYNFEPPVLTDVVRAEAQTSNESIQRLVRGYDAFRSTYLYLCTSMGDRRHYMSVYLLSVSGSLDN